MQRILPIVLLIALTVAGSGFTQAQSTTKKNNLEQEKVGFFTRHIGLTADEAKLFWPVYNEMEKEFRELHEQQKNLTEGKKLEELSDEELDKIMNERLELKQKEVDLEKKYLAKFKDILPLKKVAKIYVAQEKWTKYLLDKIKSGNPNRTAPHHKPVRGG